MKLLVSLVFLLLLAGATVTRGQDFEKINKWFSESGIAVRHTFQGSSKEESRPATIFFVFSEKPSDDDYFLADVAIKISEIELTPGSSSLLFYPTVEWHTSTQRDKNKSVASLGVNAELRPFGLKPPQSPPPGSTNNGLLVSPTFLGEIKGMRDFQLDSTSVKVSMLVFPTSMLSGLPGSHIRDGNGVYRARYYPYAGVEYWNRPLGGSAEPASFLALKMYAEVIPLATLTREYVQITATYTFRRRLGSGLSLPRAMHGLSLAATFYFGGQANFGVGIDYLVGRDPNRGFAEVDRWNFGLKVKY